MNPPDLLQKLRNEQADFFNTTDRRPRPTAKDALIKPVFLYPDDNSKTILKKLKREDINVCVVVTRDKKFVGKISDEDIIRLFHQQINEEEITNQTNAGYRRKFLYHKAEQLINNYRSTASPETPINEVIRLILEENFQYIPVIDKGMRVIGVVTPSSVIQLLQDR